MAAQWMTNGFKLLLLETQTHRAKDRTDSWECVSPRRMCATNSGKWGEIDCKDQRLKIKRSEDRKIVVVNQERKQRKVRGDRLKQKYAFAKVGWQNPSGKWVWLWKIPLCMTHFHERIKQTLSSNISKSTPPLSKFHVRHNHPLQWEIQWGWRRERNETIKNIHKNGTLNLSFNPVCSRLYYVTNWTRVWGH